MNTTQTEQTELIALIDNGGIIHQITGTAIEGEGIFCNGVEYIAGFDKQGNIFASFVDENDTVLNFDGHKTGWRLGLKLSDAHLNYLKTIHN